MKFVDQINQQFEIKETPKRIVSLVPSQTELLVDLGLESSIVGITKFCIHPKNLKNEKTIVGGTKNSKLEVIKNLKPDIILCNKEENTKEIVTLCKEIAPTHVSDIYTIDDTIELIKQYGELFNCNDNALKIIDELNLKLTDFKEFIKNKNYKNVAYFIWKSPCMVAGNNTFINHLLEVNKFNNVYKNETRYPIIEIEDLNKKENLDLVLLSSEPYPFKNKHILELQKTLPNTKALLVDGELFSWYGSRLLKSFDYFKKLYSEINSNA